MLNLTTRHLKILLVFERILIYHITLSDVTVLHDGIPWIAIFLLE